MKAPPFFPIYPGEFINDSRFAFLSTAEIGGVFLLLIWQWQNESIPDDPAKLAHICRCDIGKDKVDISTLYPAIKEVFSVDLGNGERRNRWLHEKRQELLAQRGKMAQGGKVGMQRRWASDKVVNKDLIKDLNKVVIQHNITKHNLTEQNGTEQNGVVPAIAVTTLGQLPDYSGTTPGVLPEQMRNGNEKKARSESKVFTYPEDFERFWKAYPKKRAKRNAYREWVKLRPRPDLEVILAAIERLKKSGRELQFYKDPERWLKGACWEDEVEPPKKQIYDLLN
jgi:uncharacterized protein YdaU (DUF1376 family)